MTGVPKIVLRNGRLILPDRIVEGAAVVIEGGRIADIVSDGNPPAGDVVVDLEGAYLAPGMIDIHIHGARGVDVLTASPEGLTRWAQFLLTEGVTGFLPTTVPTDEAGYREVLRSLLDYLRAGPPSDAARILGVHFEGPFVNPFRAGALRVEYLRSYRRPDDLDVFLSGDFPVRPFVRMMTLAPEIHGGLDLIQELAARGFLLAIGHSQALVGECQQAARRGARHITHFFNALAPLHHRNPGVVGWGMVADSVTVDLIADGHHLDELMIELVRRTKGAHRIALISDAIAPTGLGDGSFEVWGQTIRVSGGKTANPAGSLAGSVITLRDAVRNLRRWGVPLTEIMQMASLVPARLLGLEAELGSIEPGKRADLIAFDDETTIRFVMLDGNIVVGNGTADSPARS